jgi:hypothetical protein
MQKQISSVYTRKVQFKGYTYPFFSEEIFKGRTKYRVLIQVMYRKRQLETFLDTKIVLVWLVK